jgi:hypothetical protein
MRFFALSVRYRRNRKKRGGLVEDVDVSVGTGGACKFARGLCVRVADGALCHLISFSMI